jgi:predicted membrane-bound mannosyltransferase
LISFIEAFHKYFIRGTTTPEHTHSWYYYLKILFFYDAGDRWFISELPLLVIAIPGFIVCFKDRLGKKGILFSSLFITCLILFSLIPYKTPWNMLGLVPVMALIGGITIAYFWQMFKISNLKLVFISPLLLLLILLFHEAWQLNYVYSDAPENPFTYGHARQEIKRISNKLDELRHKYHYLLKTRIDVIAKNAEYWPLPWYLREYEKVAWWDTVPNDIASTPIVFLTPEMESDFIYQLYEKTPYEKRKLYLPLFDHEIELRPGVMIRGYIHKELWEKIYINN